MKRFLVSGELSQGARLRLSPEESRHCVRVMRLGPGDTVLLSDGKGTEAEARIIAAEKGGVEVEVTALREAASRGFRLHLVQATLKGPRMDWLVEKATELGVDAIHVIESEHTVAGGEREERWQRIAQAAVKQSGSPRVPEIHGAAPIEQVLSRISTPYAGFLLSPSAKAGLAEAVHARLSGGATQFVLVIGPEGGFSRGEEEAFQSRGFQPCLLSTQILRGETAALTALAIALHALEIGTASRL